MQKVVRTYPEEKYRNPTASLQECLQEGWNVVMANKFDICSDYTGKPLGIHGTEYILEKEDW